MANVPVIEVGTGKETRVVQPVLLVALTSTGVLVPVKVTADGKIKS